MTIKDTSTEEKIKEAAKKVFQQKGFAGARTRDIAEEAGINLALLNYYYRSKERLFKIVMQDAFQEFFPNIRHIIKDDNSSLSEKLESLANNYTDLLTATPNLPLFIFGEMRSNPESFFKDLGLGDLSFHNTAFYKQLSERIALSQNPNLSPIHFIINALSLIIFPFVSYPILSFAAKFEGEEASVFLEERRKLIPIWIELMLK